VTGTLTNGKSFTTVIPGPASPTFAQQLRAEGVQSVTAAAPSSGLGSTIFYLLILLLPVILVLWLSRRMARAGGGGVSLGALGIARSNAKVFNAERPQTNFADVAGYEGVKSE